MSKHALLLVSLVASCADPAPKPVYPDLFEEVWAATIRPGDLVIAVPGTGAYSSLGKVIEDQIDPAQPDAVEIDGRTLISNVEVLEGAIAAVQRAGITSAELEAGTITIALWGSGITKLDSFRYLSLGKLHVRVEVLGGLSKCGVGGIPENLSNYNAGNAKADAEDLYRRTRDWLANDGGVPRNVVLASHSWGGIVAEYVASNAAELEVKNGPLPGGSTIEFAIAGGVPAFVPDFRPHGPGFRTVTSTFEGTTANVRTYEVNRPDDPVHSFNPRETGGGHHYVIMFGDEYQGWFGITTDEMSCVDIPGPCPQR
ncbi:MAG: hypothetical protein WKG01_11645 [Kofleriaceae bacterium]